MEIVEAIINAFSGLLIENRTMKKLLRGEVVSDLERILRDAKANPEAKRQMEKLLAPLRTAIEDEVAVERLFQDIAERPISDDPN
jgi:hypothetical protein